MSIVIPLLPPVCLHGGDVDRFTFLTEASSVLILDIITTPRTQPTLYAQWHNKQRAHRSPCNFLQAKECELWVLQHGKKNDCRRNQKTLVTGQWAEYLKLRVRTRHRHGENNISSSFHYLLTLHFEVFWDVTACSWLSRTRRFGDESNANLQNVENYFPTKCHGATPQKTPLSEP